MNYVWINFFLSFFRTTGNIVVEDGDTQTSGFEHENESFLAQDVLSDSQSSVQPRKKKKEQDQNFQNVLIDFIKNPPLKPPEEFDADKSFLVSFLPDLKRMNENQKLDLKIMFAQCVKQVLNSNTAPPAQHPRDIYINYPDSYSFPNTPENFQARLPTQLLQNFSSGFPNQASQINFPSNFNSASFNTK